MGNTGWIASGILFAALAIILTRLLRDRAFRKQRGIFTPWPIPTISLQTLDTVFYVTEFGPSLDTEVSFIGRGPIIVPGGTSDAEAWVLAVLAKRANRFFEFGTCTGKTAYLWARNAASDARVVTLTLSPEQQREYAKVDGDSDVDTKFALEESTFTNFLYSSTTAANSIEQLYGDSKHFDETPWRDYADIVFVDGSHARSYVESDSVKAMRIVKPGGLVLWHDYAGPRHAPGVFAALNALAKRFELKHVQGTTFVAWRRPV